MKQLRRRSTSRFAKRLRRNASRLFVIIINTFLKTIQRHRMRNGLKSFTLTILVSFSNHVVIDHRFYLADDEHRQLWNENLGNGARSFVPVRHVESNTSSDEDTSSSTM